VFLSVTADHADESADDGPAAAAADDDGAVGDDR
jgi:hypothetical protein